MATRSRVRLHRFVDDDGSPFCARCGLIARHDAHARCPYCRRQRPGACERCQPDPEPDLTPVLEPDPDWTLFDDPEPDTPTP